MLKTILPTHDAKWNTDYTDKKTDLHGFFLDSSDGDFPPVRIGQMPGALQKQKADQKIPKESV